MLSVTVAGQIAIAESAFTWPIRQGVEPVQVPLHFAPRAARAIMESNGGKPLTIVVRGDDNRVVEIKDVYALKILPGQHPHLVQLLFSDRRWLWKNCHILRRYNIRRNMGLRRVETPGGRPEDDPVIDDAQYALWSLKEQSATALWTPGEAVGDILKRLARYEKEYSGAVMRWLIKDSLSRLTDPIPIEDLELDEPGDAAMMRALASISSSVTVLLDGRVFVQPKGDGGEAAEVQKLGPAMVGRGYAIPVDNRWVRHKKIHVGFTREQELRFDYSEPTSSGTTTADDGDARIIDNVLPIPDYQLEVNGKTLPQGTWITITEALNAWGAPPGLGALDYSFLRQAFLPFLDLWAAVLISGQRDGDADWSGRISALQQHWRRTYRVNRRWVDRILQFKAYRVATIHPQTGTRAPAMAYCDHVKLFSQKSLWVNAGQGKELEYARNETGWADPIDSTTRCAPARVSILDHDQGVIHVEFLQDPARIYDIVMPGNLLQSSIPGYDYRNQDQNIAFNAVIEGMAPPTLEAGFQMSVILTAVPASPNTDGQLHWVEITPDDVTDLMPPAAAAAAKASRGPELWIRVGPGMETARCAWSDADKERIERSFGVGGLDNEPAEGKAAWEDLSDLVVNASTASGRGAAGVNNVARAVASRIWMSQIDRMHGSWSAGINPGVLPAGFLNEVTHTVEPDGVMSTSVSFPEDYPKLDLLAYLDASTRARIMRLIQQ